MASVYIVVSEEYYGGGANQIRVFTNEPDAQSYAYNIAISNNLDMCIYKANIDTLENLTWINVHHNYTVDDPVPAH